MQKRTIYIKINLLDGRIGRWLSTDPYGQYHSPYLGMGNNPIIGIDPRGGYCETCPSDDYWNEYISSSYYWTFDDGITFLSDVGFEINGNNWYDPLLNWDSDFNRVNTGDAISISADGVFAYQPGQEYFFGKSFKYELMFILHGSDRFTFKPVITFGDNVELIDASIGVQLNKYFYSGNINNYKSTIIQGSGQSIGVGLEFFDLGLSRTSMDKYGNRLYGGSLGVSFGSLYGITLQRNTETIPWREEW